MKKKTRVAKRFYEERGLELPRLEYWPENADELRELIEEGDNERVILGGGHHFRGLIVPDGEVIRTGRCRAIISLDKTSGLVEVEAGLSWKDLQEALVEDGFSLERYGLYPLTSTVGGLLSMDHQVSKDLFYGDIRDGCVALSAAAPGHRRYRYLAAPRKASGPDFRYLYIGGEGAYGAILEATFVVSRPGDGRLFRWQVDGPGGAAQAARTLFRLGLRPVWCHYDGVKQAFVAAVVGPARILAAAETVAADALGAPVGVEDKDGLDGFRRALEGRRLRKGTTVPMSMARLLDKGLHANQVLEIRHFSAHRALVTLKSGE